MTKKTKSSNTVAFKSKRSIKNWDDYLSDPDGREPEFRSKNEEIKFLRKKIAYLEEMLAVLIQEVDLHTDYFDNLDEADRVEEEVEALLRGEYKPLPDAQKPSDEELEMYLEYMKKMDKLLEDVFDLTDAAEVSPLDLADTIYDIADFIGEAGDIDDFDE